MNILSKILAIGLFFTSGSLSAQFSVTIQVDHNIQCFNGADGVLTAIVNPAGSAYTFSWSNGGNTASITDLTAGAYVVTVQSVTGGTAVATAVLSEPAELVLNSLTELPLYVNPSGTVDIETSGGTAPYAFQWINQSNLPFANTEDLVDAPAGIYTQTVTDANGCVVVFSPVTLIMTSAASDWEGQSLRIFPNPASDILTIATNEGESQLVQIYNSSGQLVLSERIQGTPSIISVNNWPAGTYQLVFPESFRRATVIIKH